MKMLLLLPIFLASCTTTSSINIVKSRVSFHLQCTTEAGETYVDDWFDNKTQYVEFIYRRDSRCTIKQENK